jgi:hypothetical protein
MPDYLERPFDLLKDAESLNYVIPDPDTTNIIDKVYMLNAYLVKYYLVKYDGMKNIQIANMSTFTVVDFESDVISKLANIDYLIIEFCDVLKVTRIFSNQVLSAIVAILLQRAGTKKPTVLEFENSEFVEKLPMNDGVFERFVYDCKEMAEEVTL